jgi:hypothetical protein
MTIIGAFSNGIDIPYHHGVTFGGIWASIIWPKHGFKQK